MFYFISKLVCVNHGKVYFDISAFDRGNLDHMHTIHISGISFVYVSFYETARYFILSIVHIS